MKKIDKSEKKALITWGVIGIIILICAIVLRVVLINNDSLLSSGKYEPVRDVDRYYTVQTAINKYYSFINARKYDSVINILDTKYVTNNNITESNIKEFVTNNEYSLVFESGIMCSKEVKSGVFSYILDGHEIESRSTGTKILESKYYEVVLDGNSLLFSLKPINQEDYEGACK